MPMRSSTKLSVIVAAYNEEATIALVLKAVEGVDLSALGVEKEVIVVDDGSLDRTGEIVRSRFPGVLCLEHPINRGKGTAIRTGIARATGDILLIQDADMEYDPGDYPRLIRPILDGKARVVYGSRFLHDWYPKRMGVAHFFGNHLLTAMANLFFGCRITDEATCYKVFEAGLLRSIPLECEEFEFCPEVTAKLGLLGIPIHEVPIDYSARLPSEGKKICWTDGIQAIKVLLKYWLFEGRRFLRSMGPPRP